MFWEQLDDYGVKYDTESLRVWRKKRNPTCSGRDHRDGKKKATSVGRKLSGRREKMSVHNRGVAKKKHGGGGNGGNKHTNTMDRKLRHKGQTEGKKPQGKESLSRGRNRTSTQFTRRWQQRSSRTNLQRTTAFEKGGEYLRRGGEGAKQRY